MSSLFMRFPGGKDRVFTMSYDDGVEQDIKLMEIMDKNGLKGTFNINAGLFAEEGTVYPKGHIHRRMTLDQVKNLYIGSGHEVAIHGLTHPFLEQLPDARMVYEIIEDRRRLEGIFGCTIRGSAYPFGTTSDAVVTALKAAGIVYSRTVVSSGNFDISDDWLRLSATCKHTDPGLMELADEFLNQVKRRKPKMFYLWGHSYEFETDNNWGIIESFAEKIGGYDDVWYATNIEIFDYITAYKQLRFGVDMKFVENPTATDLYFIRNDKDYMVKAGQSIKID